RFYPLRRVGQPADVAAAAVYFASDEAAWVSGAVLLVSGGAVMTSDPYRYLMRVNPEGAGAPNERERSSPPGAPPPPSGWEGAGGCGGPRMTQTADLVVVGAGIAGASTAFFAAEHGLRTVVVEEGLPASGASGRTAGYIRCHYANPHEAHFAYESWKIHARWRELIGGDNGYRRSGFLFIVPPALGPPLEKNVALMHAM